MSIKWKTYSMCSISSKSVYKEKMDLGHRP